MATKKRTRKAASGRPLKAAALVAGGIVGILIAAQAFSAPAADPYAIEHPTPSRMTPRRRKPEPKARPQVGAGGAEVLQRGQTSDKVKNVQIALVKLGGEAAAEIVNNGGADGRYGPATERALAKAGVANPATLSPAEYKNILNKAAEKSKPAPKTGLFDFLSKKGQPVPPKPKPKPKPAGLLDFLNKKGPAVPKVAPKPQLQVKAQTVVVGGKKVVKPVLVQKPAARAAQPLPQRPLAPKSMAPKPLARPLPKKPAQRPVVVVQKPALKFVPQRKPVARPAGPIKI